MEASTSFNRESSRQEIDRIFELQAESSRSIALTGVRQRKKWLNALLKSVMSHREQIRIAIYKDCRRHESEVDMTEIYPVISEIKCARRSLSIWMSKKTKATPFALMGSSSWTKAEPKGRVLIISPWNFPVNLTLSPLVSALAAGNTVILKPSEFTPNTNRVIAKIVKEIFDEDHVYMVEGAVETTQYILSKPFNHIFFTGSPTVGKIVMKAAAENLTSVTLELGGKSPTIVDKTADLKKAAKRIAWGKFVNNGQICIAPDYIMAHESIKEELENQLSHFLDEFYPNPASDPSYSRIINRRNFDRVKGYLNDAKDKGARIVYGGSTDAEQLYIQPTLIEDIKEDSRVLEEEIFGPLLPIRSYKTNEQLCEYINSKPNPLALYIYSTSRKTIDYIQSHTRAGATCINHNALHFYNTNLPFGGVNNSGMGKAHGEDGFREFSNARAVYKQNMPNALELLVPPYNGFKQKLIDLTLKYF